MPQTPPSFFMRRPSEEASEDSTASATLRQMLGEQPPAEQSPDTRAARFQTRFGFDPLEIVDVFSGATGSGFLEADASRGEKLGNLLATMLPFKPSAGLLRRLFSTGRKVGLGTTSLSTTSSLSAQPMPRLVGAMVPPNATDLRLSFDLRHGPLPTAEDIHTMFPGMGNVLHVERFAPTVFRPDDGTVRISISTLAVPDPQRRKQLLQDLLQRLGGTFREGRIAGPGGR